MKIEYVILDENLRFEDVRPYVSCLPSQRQEKIARYRFERDKLLSFAAGLLIRHAVGERTILLGEHGKPYVDDKALCFSVSHSGRIAAVAADDMEIGLDVEQLPEENRLRIADRFFHPEERAYVAAAQDQRRAFCEIWTRKEAYLKMTGEGITTDLTAFDTVSSPLSAQMFTTAVDHCCLSLCSLIPIGERTVDISQIELKELIV